MNENHEQCLEGVRTLTYCYAGFLLILCMISIVGYYTLHQKNQRLQREVDYYNHTYLRETGGTAFWKGVSNGIVLYDLRSFDCGKHWCAVKSAEGTNDGFIVLGDAELVFPGLRKTVSDLDTVVEYAKKHGPLNPSDPVQKQVLENNGFTIVTNK